MADNSLDTKLEGLARQYDAVLEFPTGQGTSKTVTIIPRNQLEASIRVEVPLIDATKWLQTAATAAGADAAAARTRSTHDQVQRQVVSAYYVYTAANAVLESAHRSLEVSRSQLEVTGARTSAGVANELDLMRARSEVERNAQVVADAESMLATSGRTLRTLSGLEPGTVTGLPVDDLHPAPALETLEQGLGALPQVQSVTLVFYELETTLQADAAGGYQQRRRAVPRARFRVGREKGAALDPVAVDMLLGPETCLSNGRNLLDLLWTPESTPAP